MKTTTTALVLTLAVTAAACSSTSPISPVAPSAGTTGALEDTASAGGQNGRAKLPTIAGIAVENGNFSTLVMALDKAGLVSTFDGSRQFTVFAPTNLAFDAAAAALLKDASKTGPDLVAALDVPTLTAVLLYHVTEGSRFSTGLVRSGAVKMLDGNAAEITMGESGAMIEQAGIAAVDIRASNGVIHVIDAVLLPPSLR